MFLIFCFLCFIVCVVVVVVCIVVDEGEGVFCLYSGCKNKESCW